MISWEEGFGELKQAIEQMLKINSYNNYINKLKTQQGTATSDDYKHALALELDNAQILKNYSKDQIKDHLKELDLKIKCHALGITPAPLEVILRSEKFLMVMQTYIFKCKGEICKDHTKAIAQTIELLKSAEVSPSLYSFYQFIEKAEEDNNIVINFAEKKAISEYQKQPKIIDDFMANVNREVRINAIVKIMADEIDVAIDIQQLNNIFKQDLSKEVSDNFDIATKYYLENDGYAIGVLGDFKLDIEEIKQHGYNMFSMIAY